MKNEITKRGKKAEGKQCVAETESVGWKIEGEFENIKELLCAVSPKAIVRLIHKKISFNFSLCHVDFFQLFFFDDRS